MSITQEPFGFLPDGHEATIFTLRNAHGIEMDMTNYGGIVTRLTTPDRHGEFADIVLGFKTLESYQKDSPYFGALIGRYGNRIADGRFELDGTTYELAVNNGPNHLHGGLKGFDKVLWTAERIEENDRSIVRLSYLSPDGEEGYPGDLSVAVDHILTEENEFILEYTATSDKTTVVNLTHHSYFNLTGEGSGDILGHIISLNADAFTPSNTDLIPTGEIRSVGGTDMDFSLPQRIGNRINSNYEQIAQAGGFDHNFVLVNRDGSLAPAARVTEPESGRVLEVLTTEPGIQLYTGNMLDGTLKGKTGAIYHKHSGLCLETQHFPDSPNHPQFPSTVLKPGETYRHKTVYRFGTD
ncbi:MAG: galactose-1-epimerase [Chitinivibrionales bacterium]|nr:galactose-1-epimerase [Chitinivibrionales bacterium]MBD3358985.1 galactose-1-epimerase [Chitinivibrionales bacterium]